MNIKFGTSGWRDIIADGFTFQNVRFCTQAIADHLIATGKTGGIILGRDARFMGHAFMEVAARVLAANGIKAFMCVRDTPTPVISFEIRRRKTAGGINFTASHNPPEYQGLKFSPDWGGPALPETTNDIEKRANTLLGGSGAVKDMSIAEARRQGLVEDIDPMQPYLDDLKTKIDLAIIRKANLKILANPMYGTARGYLDRILLDAGCDVTVINANEDPYFGHQPPEPSEAHIPDMLQRMKEGSFDLGLATDGDADRFGILGPKGQFFEPNQVLGMLLEYLKTTRTWEGGVARSVATSHLVDAVAEKHGMNVFETPVGFKFIGDLIAKDQILLGGEESAGLSIKGHVPEKDGIIACLLVAEMVAAKGVPIHQILTGLYEHVGTFFTKRLNFRLTEEQKSRALEALKQDPSEIAGRKVRQIIRIDGTKFLLDNGAWVLLRFSGTEPVVRFYVEARNEADFKALVAYGSTMFS